MNKKGAAAIADATGTAGTIAAAGVKRSKFAA